MDASRGGPHVGDGVSFGRNDCRIEVADVPEAQPLARSHGFHAFADQYGERHLCERHGSGGDASYEIVTPDQARSCGVDDAALAAAMGTPWPA